MEPSGLTFSNHFFAVLLQTLDELMGTNGLNALLNAAGLKEWTTTPPPSNMKREVDFTQISALTGALVDLYGDKGSQSLLRPANRKVFEELWAHDPQLDFTKDLQFTVLEPHKRLHHGLSKFAETLNAISDIRAQVVESESGIGFKLDRCPYCWESSGESARCSAFLGLLERACQHFLEEPTEIEETDCACSGEGYCVFSIQIHS